LISGRYQTSPRFGRKGPRQSTQGVQRSYLPSQLHLTTTQKLNREVYIWHRLEHPNIVKLFGTSYHMGGRPSMVMRWYQNGSASEYLRDRGDVIVDRKSLVRPLRLLHWL
jgi:serine/threonine protein kinase